MLRKIPTLGLFFAAIWSVCLTNENTYALELKPSEIRAKTNEKPVAVLQKRFFLKKWRPEFGVLSGGFLNEAYTKTEKRGVRFSLFPSEWAGVEAQYIDTSVSSSEDKAALDTLKFRKRPQDLDDDEDPDKDVTPQPEVNKIHSILDLNAVVAPFYGKLNLLDAAIVYMDTYLTAGVAQLNTDQGAKTGISLGIGQRYYMFRSLSLRIDFRNHSLTEERANKQTRRNQQSWDFGVSWFFF